jgi:hypothetical protein
VNDPDDDRRRHRPGFERNSERQPDDSSGSNQAAPGKRSLVEVEMSRSLQGGPQRPATRAEQQPIERQSHESTPDDYVAGHLEHVIAAIREGLHQARLVAPHPGHLVWNAEDVAIGEIASAIGEHIAEAPLHRLTAFARGADIHAIVEGGRSSPGTEWQPEIGEMIADKLHATIIESIQRMGRQVWNSFQVLGRMPAASQLDAHSAIDRVIRRVLVRPGIVRPAVASSPTTASPSSNRSLVPNEVGSANAEADADPVKIAEQGVAEASEPLPHAGTLQPLFGHHDLSPIKAQVGGPAADAARALGAEAYTIGDRVGFANPPDVNTAAHEATHAIEGQASVARKATVDEGASDPREQRANAIAAAVDRGEHVEAQLDRAVQAPSPMAAVHRKRDGDASASGHPGALPLYVDIHENAMRDAVGRHLSDTAWPAPASDVRWTDGGDRAFATNLWRWLRPKLGDAAALRALVAPGKLDQRFQRYVYDKKWSPAFGKAVAQLVEWSARDALVERVGRRYRALWASRNAPPEADEIAGTHPMDALVARALVGPGVVDLFEIPAVEASTTHSPTRARSPRKGRKPAADEHASSPDESAPTVQQLMTIERDIGNQLTAINQQVAPLGFADELRDARDAHANRVVLLADADDATRKQYLPALQFQHTQLLSIGPSLAAVVSLYWPLRGVPDFALTPQKRAERDELKALLDIYARAAATSHDKARSTATLRQVEERARWKERDRIDAAQVSAETAMDETVTTTRSEAVDREGLDVVRHQRQSMLDDTAKGRSRYEQQKALTVASETALRARMQAARTALEQLRSTAREVFGEPSAMQEALGKLDPRLKSLPEVILDVNDRLTGVDRTWIAAIAARGSAGHKPDEGTSEEPGEATAAIQEDPNAPDDWVEWEARAQALPVAQQAFASITGDQQLGDFLNTAAKEIRHQAMANAIMQLAAALAITVITGMGAAALGRALAGALVGEAMPLAAQSTRLAMAGLRIGVDVGVNVSINSAVQIAMSGGEHSTGAVVLENALMEVFMRGLVHPLRRAQENALAYGRELSALPHLSAAERRALSSFDFAGTQMSVEMLGGMTSQWAARQIVASARATGEDVSEPFALTVLQQGAAIALGRFFHGQLAAWHAHKAALARTRIGKSAAANELFAAREAFYARAKELSDSLSPDPAAMNELVRMNDALLNQERALVESHAEEPAAGRHDLAQSEPVTGAHEPHAPHDLPAAHGAETARHPTAANTAAEQTSTGHEPSSAEHAEAPNLGQRVAAEAGARYVGDGRFEVDGTTGQVVIEVRRTNGESRTQFDGERGVIEVPSGIAGKELERAIVLGLARVRNEIHTSGSHGQVADPKATALIERLGADKAFAEQHAHAPGSVPIDAVLGMVAEWPGITPAQRGEQIHLLETLIAEGTGRGKANSSVRDLSPEKTNVRDGVVEAPEKVTIASVSGSPDVGLLNKMLDAKRILQTGTDPHERDLAMRAFAAALTKYRDTIGMQKPDAATYDASIKTTDEFFVRYKMIAAHGLGTAEIASQRASADQLGMQELRYGSDKSSVATLHAEADQLLRNAPMDADVSNTFATTKNRLADPNAAKNEQQLMVEFVKAWESDPTMQRAFNGFESAGVENSKKPPALLWEAAAQRTFRNAIGLREHVAEAVKTPADARGLSERIARSNGTSAPEAEVMLQRYRSDGYEAALAATEARASELRGDGKVATMPTVDADTQQVAERFAGLSIESVAADTRVIVEALRSWSAETGVQRGDVTLLGMTMHAGEQLLNTALDTAPDAKDGPFVLLDQVDQAVSLGVDRIGHGLILGIEPEILVAKDRLKPEDVERFRARQRQVLEHVRARGVVIETNLSSNTEISNLTQGQHPAGRFAREGLRVTVNTDDETVLATTIQREFERVSRAPGVTRHDIATMTLEGYRSRLGNRELGQRGRLKPQLVNALLHGLGPDEAVALATHLAHYFHIDPDGSPRAVITRVIDATLGL